MKTLYAVVTYNHQYYYEVNHEAQRRAIASLIAKLQYLETEIVTNTEGKINISLNGNVFVNNYASVLTRKIRNA